VGGFTSDEGGPGWGTSGSVLYREDHNRLCTSVFAEVGGREH